MKKYLTLVRITIIAAVGLFIFGFFISFLLLDSAAIVGVENIHALSSTDPLQFWASTGLLFALCALWTTILHLVCFSTATASFTITRYILFLIVSIISVFVGIGLRLLFLTSILWGSVGIPLGELQFFRWGLTVNLLVCGIIIVFFVISRFKQMSLFKRPA